MAIGKITFRSTGGKGIQVAATSLNMDTYFFSRSPPASLGAKIGAAYGGFGSIGGYSIIFELCTMSGELLGKVVAVGAEVIVVER